MLLFEFAPQSYQMASLIDMLDDSMIAQIADVLIAPLNARIRAICPRMRDVIARDPAQKIVKQEAHRLFYTGAARGSRCLCALAFDHIDRAGAQDLLCHTLWEGFARSNCEMCIIAREFSLLAGTFLGFDMMFASGARCGDFNMCALAVKFIAEDIKSGAFSIQSPSTFALYLSHLAGDLGQPGLAKEECRQLAVSLQSCAASAGMTADFSDLLICAAYLGRDDLCELAVELGDPRTLRFDRMLEEANEGAASCFVRKGSGYDAIRALHARMT